MAIVKGLQFRSIDTPRVTWVSNPLDEARIFAFCTTHEADQPVIDYSDPRNHATDNDVLWYDIFCGRASPRQDIPPPKGFVVEHPDALNWDCYFEDAGELFSAKLIKAMEPAIQSFEAIETHINGQPYFYLLPTRRFDVLDRKRSDVRYFDDACTRVMDIKHYEFRNEHILTDPMVFCITEKPCMKFATAGVQRLIEKSGCRGVTLRRLP